MLKAQLEESVHNMSGITATFKPNVHSTSRPGGVVVHADKIDLYGNVHQQYELSQPITVFKTTALNFILNTEEVDASSICLYKDEDDAKLRKWLGTEYRCIDIASFQSGENSIEKLGMLFDNRTTRINIIEFRQSNQNSRRSGKSIISDIKFHFNFVDNSNIACSERDPNTEQSTTGKVSRCICKEGFVASNGGRVLNKHDSCVNCYDGKCSFDGNFCSYDRNCMSGRCINNICTSSTVSYSGVPLLMFKILKV